MSRIKLRCFLALASHFLFPYMSANQAYAKVDGTTAVTTLMRILEAPWDAKKSPTLHQGSSTKGNWCQFTMVYYPPTLLVGIGMWHVLVFWFDPHVGTTISLEATVASPMRTYPTCQSVYQHIRILFAGATLFIGYWSSYMAIPMVTILQYGYVIQGKLGSVHGPR